MNFIVQLISVFLNFKDSYCSKLISFPFRERDGNVAKNRKKVWVGNRNRNGNGNGNGNGSGNRTAGEKQMREFGVFLISCSAVLLNSCSVLASH
jgi:hypothetical protein